MVIEIRNIIIIDSLPEQFLLDIKNNIEKYITLDDYNNQNAQINLYQNNEGLKRYKDIPSNKDASKEYFQVNFFYVPQYSDQELIDLADDININAIIVRPREINNALMKKAKGLKLIVRGGAGTNNIDLELANKLAITVENTPGLNSIATAEFFFLLMFKLVGARAIDKSHNLLSQGARDLVADDYIGNELFAKQVSIIGFGNIARALAVRCRAFGMSVKVYSPSVSNNPKLAESMSVQVANSLEDLLIDADVLLVACSLNKNTNSLLGNGLLSRMKDGAYIVNAARPQIINDQALASHINRLGGVAIDGDIPLLEPLIKILQEQKIDASNLILTHHIADQTYEAQLSIGKAVIQQTLGFFLSDLTVNVVKS